MLETPIECGGLRLDPATLEVSLHGRSIRLPLREYELLRFLMVHADRVLTPEQIYSTVWASPAAIGPTPLWCTSNACASDSATIKRTHASSRPSEASATA
jgi:hypothetical protein